MTLSDPYATPGQYRLSVRKTDNGKDEDILEDLIAVSRHIESCLHTFFNRDDELVIRYFDVPYTINRNPWYNHGVGYAESENPWLYMRGEDTVEVDPIADITGLEIFVDTNRDETYSQQLVISDYILLPRNALVGPEPKPYYILRKSTNTNWVPGANLKINAIWGWPQVPKPIERAVIQLTGILRIETPRATARITDLDGTIKASKECQEIIHSLMKPYNKQPRV